ncbi:hypothetical protein [Microbacterium aquilitoris]|uniref:Uncharacterized protein n=1 Tax=Microbacterium aquilitoris TaxID=3067307 RepID=A0ABU3GER1_9MICO|nr:MULTISPECIES: hypothetical protein [unclassified Microbacterium]MDT3329173.1 hypothetical protein [Microbacterium sp. KSW-18]MDT3345003.1 hypothetical protein [Microbacterium sp. KSW2-22]
MNGLEQNLLFAVVGLSLVTSLVVIIVGAVRRRGDDRDDRKPWDDLEPK